MTSVLEFLFYGVPLIVFGIWLVIMLWSIIQSSWKVLTTSKSQDQERKEQLPPFERIKAEMFGTERENASGFLSDIWSRIKFFILAVILMALVAWNVHGLVSLTRWLKNLLFASSSG